MSGTALVPTRLRDHADDLLHTDDIGLNPAPDRAIYQATLLRDSEPDADMAKAPPSDT
ncbi:hypothetical protein ACFQ2B_36460 [Streptomyces stramineus]